MSIKAAVVDDEPLARARLKRLLKKHSVNVVADGESGIDALNIIDKHTIDILFIDINMPLMNGLDAVRQIDQIAQDSPDSQLPAIVFCTAYDEYAIQAFQTNAVAYLLKPFDSDDVAAALLKATSVNRLQLNQLNQEQNLVQTLSIHHDGVLQNMDVAEFAYFKSVDKHVYAVLKTEQEVFIDQTLAQLEEKLNERFVRIHRNALLNKDCVGRLLRSDEGHAQVELKGGNTRLSVSRRHLSDVKKCFEL